MYLALSALDFPFCFAAVRLLGVERIGHYEHVVVSFVKDKFKAVWPTADETEGQGKLVEAEERNKDEASKCRLFSYATPVLMRLQAFGHSWCLRTLFTRASSSFEFP